MSVVKVALMWNTRYHGFNLVNEEGYSTASWEEVMYALSNQKFSYSPRPHQQEILIPLELL